MGNSVYDKNVALKLDDCIAPDDNTDRDVSTTKHGLLPKLDDDASHCLNGDGSWATPPAQEIDFNCYRRTGNDAWYTTPRIGVWCSTDCATIKDVLKASPFIAPVTITLDRMAIYVSTLKAGGLCRLGIYNDNGVSLYPGSLLLNAGEVSYGATGLASVTINQKLMAGNLYWLVSVFSILGGLVWSNYASGFYAILGNDLSGAGVKQASYAWRVTQKFGGLPATFPAGGAAVNTSSLLEVPHVFVRLSVG